MSMLVIFVITYVLWVIHILDSKAGSCLAVLGWLSFCGDWGGMAIFEKPSTAFPLIQIVLNFKSILIFIIFKALFNSRISF